MLCQQRLWAALLGDAQDASAVDSAAIRVRYHRLRPRWLRGIIGTTPIFASLYRSYSTDTDGASDTTHTCCYGPLRVARRLVDVYRVTRGSWLR